MVFSDCDLFLILKIIQLAWFIPPNYDVVGKSWLNAFYEMLEFYTLFGIEINEMYFLNQWNLVSLLYMIVCMILGVTMINYSVRKNSNGTAQ